MGSDDKKFHAVQAATGKGLWTYETGDKVPSAPAVSAEGKIVIIGSEDKKLYAVEAATGKGVWTYETGNRFHRGELWTYGTGGGIDSSPAVSADGEVVFVGSTDKKLHAVEAAIVRRGIGSIPRRL